MHYMWLWLLGLGLTLTLLITMIIQQYRRITVTIRHYKYIHNALQWMLK